MFQTTLEAIQPLSEESISFKGLIQTKHGLEDCQSLKAVYIVAFKKKNIEEPLFLTFGLYLFVIRASFFQIQLTNALQEVTQKNMDFNGLTIALADWYVFVWQTEFRLFLKKLTDTNILL